MIQAGIGPSMGQISPCCICSIDNRTPANVPSPERTIRAIRDSLLMIKELSLYARYISVFSCEHCQGKDNEMGRVHGDRKDIEPNFCFEKIKGKHCRE